MSAARTIGELAANAGAKGSTRAGWPCFNCGGERTLIEHKPGCTSASCKGCGAWLGLDLAARDDGQTNRGKS